MYKPHQAIALSEYQTENLMYEIIALRRSRHHRHASYLSQKVPNMNLSKPSGLDYFVVILSLIIAGTGVYIGFLGVLTFMIGGNIVIVTSAAILSVVGVATGVAVVRNFMLRFPA